MSESDPLPSFTGDREGLSVVLAVKNEAMYIGEALELLDFADETDMIRKFRTSLALQPIATALFANSPFKFANDCRARLAAKHFQKNQANRTAFS